MKILVIIPAFNEQDNIIRTLDDLKRHCPEMNRLVINDCSRDRTLKVLKESGTDYLDLPVNLGIGGGVQCGYLYAKEHDYDIAIQFDGDGQHEARYLREMVRPLKDDKADVVIGSRFLNGSGFQSSAMRRAGIRVLSHLIRRLCGARVLDVTSGMRAVNRRFIELYADHYAQDYPEPEAILYAGLQGGRITEVPVEMKERQNGRSSINWLRSVYYMVKVSLALIFCRLTIGWRDPDDFG